MNGLPDKNNIIREYDDFNDKLSKSDILRLVNGRDYSACFGELFFSIVKILDVSTYRNAYIQTIVSYLNEKDGENTNDGADIPNKPHKWPLNGFYNRMSDFAEMLVDNQNLLTESKRLLLLLYMLLKRRDCVLIRENVDHFAPIVSRVLGEKLNHINTTFTNPYLIKCTAKTENFFAGRRDLLIHFSNAIYRENCKKSVSLKYFKDDFTNYLRDCVAINTHDDSHACVKFCIGKLEMESLKYNEPKSPPPGTTREEQQSYCKKVLSACVIMSVLCEEFIVNHRGNSKCVLEYYPMFFAFKLH